MLAVLKLGSILIFLSSFTLKGDGIKLKLKEDPLPPKRDYRPSKWLANSAMDVWYGNKSMIEVLFRELGDVMYKLTMRPARGVSINKTSLLDNIPMRLNNSQSVHYRETLSRNISMKYIVSDVHDESGEKYPSRSIEDLTIEGI